MGYYEVFRLNGKEVYQTKSISFAKMDQTEFEQFYDRAVTIIINKYLCGVNRQQLLQEVEEFIGRP